MCSNRPKYVRPSLNGAVYLVKARITLAEMWRKKMEAMKERERTRTMNGSLYPEIMNSKTII